MKTIKITLFAILICYFQANFLHAQQVSNWISLDGEWRFALDYIQTGAQRGWTDKNYQYGNTWDKVEVPHSFSADGRYLFYEGTGWYRKAFGFKANRKNKRVLLRFEAVFNRSETWLNGVKLGAHEGGYTPFEFDVTDEIKNGENLLVVSVNNHLDSLTIPTIVSNTNNGGAVGWINYGGITRNVSIIVKPETYIEKLKIEATPHLIKKDASINFKAFINNTTSADTTVKVEFNIRKEGKIVPIKIKSIPVLIPKNSKKSISIRASIGAKNTLLWSVDDPQLYQAEAILGTDTLKVNFGIRKIEVKNAQLLLNGEPIKLGGGNLVLDYPKFGAVVNDTIADKYLRLMKEGGMEFQRLSHYPLPQNILDWADKNGMLIIAEAGNWGYLDKELDDDKLREVYKNQLKEMIEADWNHPSVIAYSVGNEFNSHTPAGIKWTKDMFDFVKTIDTTRLNTLVSNKLTQSSVVKPENEASFYADFVCANIYSGLKGFEEAIKKITNIYPAKAVLVSEWGIRADRVQTEQQRIDYIKQVTAMLRLHKQIIGASWWSFNDYYSRYQGSDKNGFRPWGLLDYDFKPRAGYWAYQEEFSPITITKKSYSNNKLIIELVARADFPFTTIKNYTLKYDNKTMPIPVLKPGQKQELTLIISANQTVNIEVCKPTGFVALNKQIEIK